MEQNTETQSNTELIFGKDQTENIVCVEPVDDVMYIFKEKNGLIEIEKRPNAFWVLAATKIDSNFQRLEGNQTYKYLRKFQTRDGFTRFRQDHRKFDTYSIFNPIESTLVMNGITYFKGMKVKNVSILSFDIETNGFKKDDDSRLFIISNTFRLGDKVEKKLFSTDDYNSDIEMLEAWCAWVREKDPSILCGHNVFMFDLPYLNFVYNRDRGSNLPLGRDGSVMTINSYSSKKRKDGSQQYEYYDGRIFGREIVDTFFLSIMFDVGRKYVSYGLKQIIKQEGMEKEGRQFIDASKIAQLWEIPAEKEKVKQYALDDSDDALKLFDLMIPSYFYFNQSIPKSLQQIINSATGSWLNSFLVRSYLQQGHSIPKTTKSDIKVEGGISFAVPGLYKNVLKVDLKSAYPSQILRFKMFDERKDPNANMYKMVKYFAEERFALKKAFKETGDKYYKNRDGSAKVALNSIYGMLNTNGLNFNNPFLAAKITRETREIIDMSLKWASGKDKHYWIKLFKEKTGKLNEKTMDKT